MTALWYLLALAVVIGLLAIAAVAENEIDRRRK